MLVTSNDLPPLAPVDTTWDEAYARVESYLRAHGIENRILLNHITSAIIGDAHARTSDEGQAVSVAMRLTHERIAEWFSRAGKELDWTDDKMRAQGRLALIMADVPGRWADHFLSPEPPPAEMIEALKSSFLLPAPEMRLSTMPPAPLEFGFSEAGDPLPLAARPRLPARAALGWIVLLGVFSIAWAASH